MTDFAEKPKVSMNGETPTTPDAGTPTAEKKTNGQFADYWVLPEEERKKGFVRPYRDAYIHIGLAAPKNLRDLTAEEHARYDQYGYAKYEEYPQGESAVVGKFWTKKELDRIGGCNSVTTMGRALSETYARDPSFYGSTFCCECGEHFRVSEFVWRNDGQPVGS